MDMYSGLVSRQLCQDAVVPVLPRLDRRRRPWRDH